MREIIFEGVQYMADVNAMYESGAFLQLPDGRVLKCMGGWLEVYPPIPASLAEVLTVNATIAASKVTQPIAGVQTYTFTHAGSVSDVDVYTLPGYKSGDHSGAYVMKEYVDDLLQACQLYRDAIESLTGYPSKPLDDGRAESEVKAAEAIEKRIRG